MEHPGASYQIMSRGNGQQAIFRGDVDRQDFVKTLAEICEKTGFKVPTNRGVWERTAVSSGMLRVRWEAGPDVAPAGA